MIVPDTLRERLTSYPSFNENEQPIFEALKQMRGWFTPTELPCAASTAYQFCQKLNYHGYIGKQSRSVDTGKGKKIKKVFYRFYQDDEFNPDRVPAYYKALLCNKYNTRSKINDF